MQVLTALLVGEFARHERAAPGIMQLDPDLQLLREVRNGVAHLGVAAERADDLLVPFPPGVRISSWSSSTSWIWAYFGNKTRWVAEVYRGSATGEVLLSIWTRRLVYSRKLPERFQNPRLFDR